MPRILSLLRSYFLPGCTISAYNSFALGGGFEADFLALTQAGYLHEVEIKRSRADFFADFKKAQFPAQKDEFTGEVIPAIGLKHDMIQAGLLSNYFWFCVPEGLVKPEEVPAYAGLIVIGHNGKEFVHRSKQCRKAPLLHKTKPTPAQREAMLVPMMYRAWKRLRVEMLVLEHAAEGQDREAKA